MLSRTECRPLLSRQILATRVLPSPYFQRNLRADFAESEDLPEVKRGGVIGVGGKIRSRGPQRRMESIHVSKEGGHRDHHAGRFPRRHSSTIANSYSVVQVGRSLVRLLRKRLGETADACAPCALRRSCRADAPRRRKGGQDGIYKAHTGGLGGTVSCRPVGLVGLRHP